MTTSDPSSMTPVEIDTELSRLWEETSKVHAQLDQYRDLVASPRTREYDRLHYEGKVSDLKSRLAALRHEASPYEAEYADHPWHRYFLVKNSNGHVHREMNCSTCFVDTRYGWLVDLADCDEDKMIEEWGELACTVCFPTAPTNPNYHRPSRRDRDARDARDAEKKARDEAKAEKAITALDGGVLYDDFGNDLRTKVAARNALSSVVQSAVWYGPESTTCSRRNPETRRACVARLSAALEAAGVDPAPVIARAEKKARKEGATHTLTEGAA